MLLQAFPLPGGGDLPELSLAIGPRRPIHLTVYVAHNHCLTFPPVRRNSVVSETITTALQLEAHLQPAPVEQFPENRDVAQPVR